MTDNMAMADGRWRQRAQEGLEKAAATEQARVSKMPEYGDRQYEPDPIKRELKSLNLYEVYRRWFPEKNRERSGGSNDVNVQCYNTNFHRGGDRNPGMSIAVAGPRAGTYHCQANCGAEGDIIDLAAVYYGLVDADFRKSQEDVPKIIALAADDLLGIPYRVKGDRYVSMQTMQTYEMGTAPISAPPPAPLPLTSVYVPSHEVRRRFEGVDVDFERITPEMAKSVPTEIFSASFEENPETLLDWRSFLPPDTPLRVYMEAACKDVKPEEFHFFNFLLLIGLLCGKNLCLVSEGIVYGNLLMCLTGATSSGKTSALNYIQDLIFDTCRFDPSVQDSTGIKFVKNPGSGEYMIGEFREEFPDPHWQPQTPKDKQPMIPHSGVRGLVVWGEMSTMAAKRSNAGSTIVGMVQDLYDNERLIQFGSKMHGKTEVENAFGSVVTTTQPPAIRKLLAREDVDSGFLNRWIFVYGKGKPPRPDLIPPDMAPVRPYVAKLRQWAQGRTGASKVLTWEREAWEEFCVEFHRIEKLFPRNDESGDPLYKRISLLFKKFILLMTANMMVTEIPTTAVRQARIMLDYVIDCYQRFGAALVQTELSEIQEAILLRLERKGDQGMKKNDLFRALGEKYGKDNVDLAINKLEGMDLIVARVPRKGPGPGREPAKRYFLTD